MADIDLNSPLECDIEAIQGADADFTIPNIPRTLVVGDVYRMVIRQKRATEPAATATSENTGLDVGGFEDTFEDAFEIYGFTRAGLLTAVANTITPVETDVTVALPYPVTEKLSGRYVYDIDVVSATRKVTTLVRGTIRFESDVTKQNIF